MIPPRYKKASIIDFNQDAIKPVIDWISGDKKEILFITGDSGCGKTHLMCAVCKELCNIGVRSDYALIPNMAIELRNTMNNDFDCPSETSVIKKYRNHNIVGVFDDLAANKPSEYVLESLYAIINDRYQDLSPSIYSSNLSIGKISEIYGDRIASRLASGIVFKMTGKDRRILK